MLAQRRRRWANIEPTFGHIGVFFWECEILIPCYHQELVITKDVT